MALLRRFVIVFFLFIVNFAESSADDAGALLRLKSKLDPSNTLRWRGLNYCRWEGVKECVNGRVTKLVMELKNLNGTLEQSSLNRLDQLRVLSFKGNFISGQIPDLSGLINLKSLFLNDNRFSGEFPSSVTDLHRLKVIVLSGNLISGQIPASLVKLRRLYILFLQDNRLSGTIPALNQSSLKFFNVSSNRLSGQIPVTAVLLQFNSSSFQKNPHLCGEQLQKPCSTWNTTTATSPVFEMKKKSRKKIGIILGSTLAGLFLAIICVVACCCCFLGSSTRSGGRRETEDPAATGGNKRGGMEHQHQQQASSAAQQQQQQQQGGRVKYNNTSSFPWDQNGLGTLTFCGGGGGGGGATDQIYSLEDLLKASAETLGRGTMGSTYKAVMESGFIVTVKRLKNSTSPGMEEFERHMEMLGQLRHPNLVPLRAYFQAKEERLLVYDYFPNGSLYSLIHGTRPSGGKPLHWTSCLKIAEDLATSLVYLHQTPGLIHGNIKSSNVLLGSDFESCLTDYGLLPFHSDPLEEPPLLFYKAPEARNQRKSFTQKSDVYSFGILLLELLTGKAPSQDPVQDSGKDIPTWVRSVREEETESGEDPASGNEVSDEKLVALLNIAMTCVSSVPDSRPSMRDVLRMIQEARVEAQASSNSSDHSPGRWSDTVQSLPREAGSEHLNFTERD